MALEVKEVAHMVVTALVKVNFIEFLFLYIIFYACVSDIQ